MDFDHPPADPIEQFNRWFAEAQQTELPNPNAMTLATVDGHGQPSARIVLLKDIDARGAVFFTNYHSAKARDLEADPKAALLFHWDPLNRQVRLRGTARRVSAEESDAYFATRPRPSQIGAWASDQSQPVQTRAELDGRVKEAEQRFANEKVSRPPHWGGYRVQLNAIEFWQGHEHRLHDRVLYVKQDDGSWSAQRLCP